MNLIVVESPTKARTLSRFLGKEYILEATMGHIKDLPKEKLGVDVENNFKPNYLIVSKKKKSIDNIKSAAKKADRIYLATDPDREGEAIAQHAREILSEKDTKLLSANKKKNYLISRIVFHEITKEAVEDALKHPRNVDINLVNAQIARRVLDRLVGYKLSPLLWKKIRRGLSAGRVQSVTVKLIVEREREIEKFKPQEYWEIYCDLKLRRLSSGKIMRVEPQEFTAQLIKIAGSRAEIKDRETAKKVVTDLEKSDYKIFDVKMRQIVKSSYPPFTTSTMTQGAARLFGWSAKRTMSIAQRLYEEGLITYHRTDSVNLSSAAVAKVREYISKTYGANYLPENPRFFKKTSRLAQEAHEAIRPTDVSVSIKMQSAKMEKDGERLYELIWKRFVACQMTACIFDETTIEVEANSKQNDNITIEQLNNYLLRASGQVLKFDGWRRVIPLAKDEEPELPLVEKDEALDLIKVNSFQKFTQPPSRYNEASLIKTLEKLGIGRPSTYAPIISTIQVRQYVEKVEGKFYPTPVGIAVNDFLVKNFTDIVDYEFTAEMEDNLDNVAKGKKHWQEMMSFFYTPFEKKLEAVDKKSQRVKIEAEKLGQKCPKCKEGDLVVRIGRFGKFISCSRFPECDYKAKFIQKLGIKCPKCKEGEVIIQTTKKGKKFFGCSRYPKCKWASWRKPQENLKN